MTTMERTSAVLDAVGALREVLRGTVTGPDDAGYDTKRAVYNAMIDRRPAAVAECADVADVIMAVRTCVRLGAPFSVRGGGHNAGGLGVADGAVVIDLGTMRSIRVDAENRTARVEGGCRWGDVDHATHAFGLATTSGIIGTTGVGGLTLGGGVGQLARQHGLTIDNLLEADVVLADGRMVTASERSHPDLFWALRGGGGNFGIVTSFLFALHPVSTVVAGPVLYDVADTVDVLRWYREVLPTLPEQLSGWFALLTIPPVDAFPENLWLRKVCGIVWCWAGEPERGPEALAPLRSFGTPLLDGIAEMPYPAMQSMFDALYPPGLQWYWRADFFREITDEAMDVHARFGAALPTPFSTMHLYPVDGAVHRVPADATAFAYRDVTWAGVIVGVDPDPANAGVITEWTRSYWDALHPSSAGGAYVNFMMDEGPERVAATYGANFARLRAVKATYDPDNVFRVNQNIPPAADATGPPAPRQGSD